MFRYTICESVDLLLVFWFIIPKNPKICIPEVFKHKWKKLQFLKNIYYLWYFGSKNLFVFVGGVGTILGVIVKVFDENLPPQFQNFQSQAPMERTRIHNLHEFQFKLSFSSRTKKPRTNWIQNYLKSKPNSSSSLSSQKFRIRQDQFSICEQSRV